MLRTLVFALLALASSSAPSVFANTVKTPRVEADLIARHTSIAPGQPVEVALRLKIIDHWHTYWQNPGDSGLPTKLAWNLPTGFSAGNIAWPYPKKLPLGPLMNFGYEGEVLHLVTITPPATLDANKPVTLSAKAEWLVCADVCIPEEGVVSLTLPVKGGPLAEDGRHASAFANARAALPKEVASLGVAAAIAGKTLEISVADAPNGALSTNEVTFYPIRDDVIANAEKQVLTRTSTGLRLAVPLADPVNKDLKSLEGVLVSATGWGAAHAGKAIAIAAPVVYGAASSAASAPIASAGTNTTADMSLILALGFALVGGLILNLMPCVFPVLGIKVMGFVQHAEHHPALLKRQGIAFFVGVLVSFWVLAGALLALRAAGESIGWGFQLQSPVFVTLLAMLFLLMALNLSGVFEMGLKLQSAAGNLDTGSSKSASRDAFFSGVLATVVATPCTAPFMGAALGYTLSQPAYVSMLVFTAIAIGMALPVTLLSFAPRWLRYLPKPGAWMDTFKQFMAFPLLATVAWLAWVLGSQQGNDGIAKLLFGLVLVALAAWLYGRWQMAKPALAMVAGAIVAASGLALAWPSADAAREVASSNAKADADWVAFSKESIASLRGEGKGVFVDFTATWCITCQVNKRVALNQAEVVKRFGELNIVRMKADWTVKDPAITAALAEFGRNGVPLYVFYPPKGDPVVLPEVLTPSVVLSHVDRGGSMRTAER
jgi:thiol:disulfide interchange protein